MASFKQVLLLAVVAAVACLASLASATVFVVGDSFGWSPKIGNWADGTTFSVGDSLLFKYPKGNHTVAQVTKDDFAACNLQGNPPLAFWDSGYDVVPLDKPGKAWFICTKPNHCLAGMKVAVDVADPTAAPSPLPFPFPRGTAPAPSPLFRWTFPRGAAPAPAPVPPVAAPPSAAARSPVGCAVAVVAATVVAAALAF